MRSRSEVLGEFQALRGELKNYLLKKLGHEQDAEDILQEFSMRLLNMDLSRVKLITEGRSFFYQSINNMCIDLHRKSKVRAAHVNENQNKNEASPSSEKVVQDQQTLDKLFLALEDLPTTCRQVFLLYRIRNLSQKEIAKELSISVNMVEKHVIKAQIKLREQMSKEGLL